MPRKLILPKEIAKHLIDEVRVRECLWNIEDSDYNNRYQTSQAWSEIVEKLKMPENRLRGKWKNLRDIFIKEVKKFGSIEDYRGKWRHFDAMKFIHRSDQNSDKNEDSNCETKQEVEESDYVEIDESDGITEFYDNTFEDPLPEKKRKVSRDDDYDEMFLKSLAPYFKQLEPIRKLVVRSKMQDMLLNEIAAQTSASHLHISTVRGGGV